MSKNEEILYLHSLNPEPNRQALGFFDAVGKEVCGDARLRDSLQVIVVVHAYESVLPFLQSLSKVFSVAGVIFKNSTSSMRPEYAQYVAEKGFKVLDIKKSDFSGAGDFDRASAELKACMDPTKKTIIMDHGGYFAFCGAELLKRDEFSSDDVIAVTEYTANGEARWKNVSLDRPVLSVGRSAIKEASDTASAEAVVFSAFSFALQHNMPLGGRKASSIGVLGYGRLGSGITDTLIRNKISVSVFDIDDIKTSGIRDAKVVTRDEILQKSDVIFCATGNRSILPADFKKLKDGAVLFTVTSPDDELDLDSVIKKGVLLPAAVKGNAYGYKVKGTSNVIWLPFNGEASNSIFPSAVSDLTIHQPYALHMVATIKVAQHLKDYGNVVQNLEPRYEELVARVWNQSNGAKASCDLH